MPKVHSIQHVTGFDYAVYTSMGEVVANASLAEDSSHWVFEPSDPTGTFHRMELNSVHACEWMALAVAQHLVDTGH